MSLYGCLAAFVIAALPSLAAAGGGGAESGALGTVLVRGSETMMQVVRIVAEEYMAGHPGAAIIVEGGGSMRGIKALIDGTADIGMASHRLDAAAIKDHLGRTGGDLAWTPIGSRPIVPIVHPSNPLDNLALQQLQSIYTGAATDWKDVGGPTQPIRVLTSDPTSGIGETWLLKVIGKGAVITPKAEVLDIAAMMEAVSRTPGAIGFLDITEYADPGRRLPVQALAVDGIPAMRSTMRETRYPVTSDLFLVTPTKSSQVARDLIAYVTTHGKGQAILAAHGIIPLN